MCGRFTQHYTWQQIHAFLSVIGAPQNLQARYNIAPTTLVDTVRHNARGPRFFCVIFHHRGPISAQRAASLAR